MRSSSRSEPITNEEVVETRLTAALLTKSPAGVTNVTKCNPGMQYNPNIGFNVLPVTFLRKPQIAFSRTLPGRHQI
jgi:hypothetical protein